MTRTRPNEPLWPRAGRSGRSAAASSSPRRTAPSGNGVSPGTVGGGWSVLRRPNPSGLRSGMRPLRGVGRERTGAALVGQRPEPLDPGEDPPLAVVEPLLDVGREEEPATGGPDPEGDRDREI